MNFRKSSKWPLTPPPPLSFANYIATSKDLEFIRWRHPGSKIFQVSCQPQDQISPGFQIPDWHRWWKTKDHPSRNSIFESQGWRQSRRWACGQYQTCLWKVGLHPVQVGGHRDISDDSLIFPSISFIFPTDTISPQPTMSKLVSKAGLLPLWLSKVGGRIISDRPTY